MDNGKGWLFELIIIVSLLSGTAGYLIVNEWWAAGIGVGLGIVFSIHSAKTHFLPVFHYYAYESAAKPEVIQHIERVILVIKVPGLSDKLIHGITRDELKMIGECVTHNGQYVFSVTHFRNYFKNSGIDGYGLYDKSVRWMKDAGALAPNAQGGVDVTEQIGKHVFEAMRDGSWDVLSEYDALP